MHTLALCFLSRVADHADRAGLCHVCRRRPHRAAVAPETSLGVFRESRSPGSHGKQALWGLAQGPLAANPMLPVLHQVHREPRARLVWAAQAGLSLLCLAVLHELTALRSAFPTAPCSWNTGGLQI